LIAAVAALGLAAAAVAQTPTPRAARLLPPRPLGPGDTPPVARGAYPDPEYPATTPVTRSRPAGPSWTDGSDPNVTTASQPDPRSKVQPAGGIPPQNGKGEPSFLSRGMDKLKGFATSDKPLIAGNAQPAQNPADAPNPNAPFRGTTTNGAPVYAGPPAYRWYGWGTVTPGANPLAPTGQYPRASAQWYAITGATPGAFPVPVTNPNRPAPGNEPPAYLPASARAAVYVPPTPPAPMRYDPPPVGSKFAPPPEPIQQSPNVGSAAPKLPTPTTPVGVPTMTPLPPPVSVLPPAVPINQAAQELPVKPVVTPPPALQPIPTMKVAAPAAPAALPASVNKDDVRWQTSPDGPTGPAREPGTWGPAAGRKAPLPADANPNWEPGATNTSRLPVARGQAPETSPPADPAATLIHAVCRGRAAGVEVRWASNVKLAVCFEAKTEAEASKLVKDISARPELKPYQIDFCVFVK
jgi:hypothetical protein